MQFVLGKAPQYHHCHMERLVHFHRMEADLDQKVVFLFVISPAATISLIFQPRITVLMEEDALLCQSYSTREVLFVSVHTSNSTENGVRRSYLTVMLVG